MQRAIRANVPGFYGRPFTSFPLTDIHAVVTTMAAAAATAYRSIKINDTDTGTDVDGQCVLGPTIWLRIDTGGGQAPAATVKVTQDEAFRLTRLLQLVGKTGRDCPFPLPAWMTERLFSTTLAYAQSLLAESLLRQAPPSRVGVVKRPADRPAMIARIGASTPFLYGMLMAASYFRFVELKNDLGAFLDALLNRADIRSLPAALGPLPGFAPALAATLKEERHVCARMRLRPGSGADQLYEPSSEEEEEEETFVDDNMAYQQLKSVCMSCRQRSGEYVCGGCHAARYCSPECQRDHYAEHASECASSSSSLRVEVMAYTEEGDRLLREILVEAILRGIDGRKLWELTQFDIVREQQRLLCLAVSNAPMRAAALSDPVWSYLLDTWMVQGRDRQMETFKATMELGAALRARKPLRAGWESPESTLGRQTLLMRGMLNDINLHVALRLAIAKELKSREEGASGAK